MVFYEYHCVQVLLGMTCMIGTHHRTKHAIIVVVDSSNGLVLMVVVMVYLNRFILSAYTLATDLHERGGLDLSECFMDDDTFILAKREGRGTKLE
jgi:hypothetical protein